MTDNKETPTAEPFRPRKTLMQGFVDRLFERGFDQDEIQLIIRNMDRSATLTGEVWTFEHECEEKNIKPTWFRYKQHLKQNDKDLQEWMKQTPERRKTWPDEE